MAAVHASTASDAGPADQEGKWDVDAASSSLSTPTTRSPALTPLLPPTDKVAMQRSLVDELPSSLLAPEPCDSKRPSPPPPSPAEGAFSRPLAPLHPPGRPPAARARRRGADMGRQPPTLHPAVGDAAVAPATARRQRYEATSEPQMSRGAIRAHREPRNEPQPTGPTTTTTTRTDTTNSTATSSSSPAAAAGHDPERSHGSPPLRIGSVRLDTPISHPRPVSRSASNASIVAARVRQPVAHRKRRSATHTDNVAQLEAAAARLSSMTSSMEESIRDLHDELKRRDSERAAALAALTRTASAGDAHAHAAPDFSLPAQVRRKASDRSTSPAAHASPRPAAYPTARGAASPRHSLTSRLRSASGRADLEAAPSLSRHRPAGASVRSVRSTKMSLQEISESEPISLTQHALDDADDASPIHEDRAALPRHWEDQRGGSSMAGPPTTHAFGPMPAQDSAPVDGVVTEPSALHQRQTDYPDRPSSPRSVDTFQPVEAAFDDFDGVHWNPDEGEAERGLDHDDAVLPPLHMDAPPPARKPSWTRTTRPTSYIDPGTGQQMLYYPARVPAVLHMPPKLSSGPKAAQKARSSAQVLKAMVEAADRSSQVPHASADGSKIHAANPLAPRRSFLPDPLLGQRHSFADMAAFDPFRDLEAPSQSERPPAEASPAGPALAPADPAASGLRRPQRLSRNPDEPDRTQLTHLPPQLRASVFLDQPPTPPDVPAKHGSAMDTLDSLLEASASAPVNAFTDHIYAGKLGGEVYGASRTRRVRASAPNLVARPTAAQPKKRRSFLWLGRSSRSRSPGDHAKAPNVDASLKRAAGQEGALDAAERESRAGSADGEARLGSAFENPGRGARSDDHEQVRNEDEDGSVGDAQDEEEDDDGASSHDPPTTLLGELRHRKQKQRRRTRLVSRLMPDGLYASLLELDAVAETTRKNKLGKRVNLAWEEAEEHDDEDGSDGDVPLGILQAKLEGAKNMADVERPQGLVEERYMEDHEPLSHRKARLRGLPPPPSARLARQAMVGPYSVGIHGAASSAPPSAREASPDPSEAEHEDETLGERKRRLEAQDQAEGKLPRARPVSGAFSAEVLSHFGDLGTRERSPVSQDAGQEEETLGQRRRRLRAEREAREREMTFFGAAAAVAARDPRPASVGKRMSMADILAAHPRREADERAKEAARRAEEPSRIAREQEERMGAWRAQALAKLAPPTVDRAAGFRGGAYNDGLGGASRPSKPLATLPMPQSPLAAPGPYGIGNDNGYGAAALHKHSRWTGAPTSSFYAGPMAQPIMMQPGYVPQGAVASRGQAGWTMDPYQIHYESYGHGHLPGRGMPTSTPMPMPMPTPMSSGSIDRVEQWRRSVFP